MRNKILVAFTMAVLVVVATTANTSAQVGSIKRSRGTRREQAQTHELRNTPTTGQLSADDQWALNEAIQDEYKARAIYAKVIEKFGEVRPFSNIIHAESRHGDALASLYRKYGLQLPRDDWRDKVPVFDTLNDACTAAIKAELDNAALYDRIMTKVSKPDLIGVFTALRDASLNNHLPAFERCLEQGGGRSDGGGRGRGRGGSGRGMGFRQRYGGRGRGSR